MRRVVELKYVIDDFKGLTRFLGFSADVAPGRIYVKRGSDIARELAEINPFLNPVSLAIVVEPASGYDGDRQVLEYFPGSLEIHFGHETQGESLVVHADDRVGLLISETAGMAEFEGYTVHVIYPSLSEREFLSFGGGLASSRGSLVGERSRRHPI